jgi:hypothetical protein
MENTCKEIIGLMSTVSPQTRSMLTVGFVVLALYFSVSFGESLGKALFYVSH